jgi:hypothetical protein
VNSISEWRHPSRDAAELADAVAGIAFAGLRVR